MRDPIHRIQFLVAFFTVLMICAPLAAVDRLVPSVYPTIMEAMEIAIDGDRILVSPGNYLGHIGFLGKQVELIGLEGATTTILDGLGTFNCVVTIDAAGSGARVSGFTIQNGFGTSCGLPLALCGGGLLITAGSPTIDACVLVNNSSSRGGALHSEQSSPTIDGCYFGGNFASQGGAISIHGGVASISNCTFVGNDAYGWGGGLAADFCSVTVSNCTFEGNASESGGGIFITESISSITDSSFSGNSAVDEGGGVLLDEFSTVQMTGCEIAANTALRGGGLAVTHFCDALIENCHIHGNVAVEDGGGVYSFECFAEYKRNRVLNNSSGLQGGGFFIRYFADPLLENCLIQYNVATISGGGVACVEAASPRIVHCTIDSNTTSGVGGGIRAQSQSFPVVINSILWRNDAMNQTAVSTGPTAGVFLDHVIMQGADPEDPLVMQLDPELDAVGYPGLCSAAIDEGTNLVDHLPLVDIDGILRPQGGRRDIGAFETAGTGHCFIRGDCNNSGDLDLADAISALDYIFSGASLAGCRDACDYDDDGWISIADVISGLVYFYQSGSPPAPPFPTPGPDTTATQSQNCWILGL
ncbi:MAG: right-handed parallel beta-helix repeat-containing protein [Planctomycetota bacterium]|nr:right-handed parallel beta-helix repeat-containing protein [Planctomycetota bacterium]